MTESIPDGYLANDLIVFGGPAGGLISAGFELEPPNLQSAPHAVRNQCQDAISACIRQWPEGTQIQILQTRALAGLTRLLEYQEQTKQCQNPTTRMLRNKNFMNLWESRKSGKLLENQVALYITRSGTLTGGDISEAAYDRCLDEARTSFKDIEQSLDQAFRQIGGRVTPLTDADNARLWAHMLNPSLAPSANYDPMKSFSPERSLLDNFWNSEIRGQAGRGFVLDGRPHRAICLRRLPTTTYPGINFPLIYPAHGDFVTVVQLSRLHKDEVIRRAQFSMERIHQQTLRKPDERQAVTIRQLQEKIRRLASGEAVPLEMEIIFLLHASNDEELADNAAALKASLQSMDGAQYYEATLPATSRNLWAKTLPGWTRSRHQGFRLYCEDRTACDLLPLGGTFCGHPGPVQALFPGNDNNLINTVMFLGEGDAATPQNLVILGTAGAGKSLTAAKILHETDHLFGFTAIIEEGASQTSYSRSHGVQRIDVRIDGTQTLNPLSTDGLPRSPLAIASQCMIVGSMIGLPPDDSKARQLQAQIGRHLDRLANDHAGEQLQKWPLDKRNQVMRHAMTLDLLARQRRISQLDAFIAFNELQQNNPDEVQKLAAQPSQAELDEFESLNGQSVRNLVFAYLLPEEHLTLSALCEHFELATEDEQQSRDLAMLLSPWCRGGSYGVLFDGASNVALDGPVVHFELGFIGEAAKQVKQVFGQIIISRTRNRVMCLPRSIKKRIIIDELSRFLSVPGSEQILREMMEQFRKFNAQVVLIFQQYSRIADSPLRAAITGNTRAWFSFNTGDKQDVERLCQDLELPGAARDAILRFPRPDQQTGPKYSEFLYYHTDARQPICGTVRYVRLPHELPKENQ